MSVIPFGRAVRLVTARSTTRQDFRIGLEAIEKGTGKLNFSPETQYDGDGVSFLPGDVLFGKLRPNLRKAWLADRGGDAVGDFHVFRPIETMMTSRYLAYIVLSEPFIEPVIASVSGAKMPRADWDEVRNVRVWVPSVGDQLAIADYLDRETAQIDAFIAKNEELITLLTERRAIVAQAIFGKRVGGGTRIKFAFRELDRRAGEEWRRLPLLSVSIHHGVAPRTTDDESASGEGDLSHYKIAARGDIVLNRMRAFQGGLGVAPCDGVVSPDYAVIRVADDLDPGWLAMLMRTDRFIGEMAMRLRGIGSTDSGAVRTPRISVADLGDIRVELPDIDAQRAELEAVTERTSRIDRALVIAQNAVVLARERRAALISAAVTGKIDVGVAA